MNTENLKRPTQATVKGQGELELLPRVPNEVETICNVDTALNRMGNVVVFAKMQSDAWWRGCKWDD
jgi:hypothetical protein